MQFYVGQAYRVAAPGTIHRGITQVRWIDDRDAAAPDHLQVVARTDERRRILVQPDADRKRVVRERGQQPAKAIALPEMLILAEGPSMLSSSISASPPPIRMSPEIFSKA